MKINKEELKTLQTIETQEYRTIDQEQKHTATECLKAEVEQHIWPTSTARDMKYKQTHNKHAKSRQQFSYDIYS